MRHIKKKERSKNGCFWCQHRLSKNERLYCIYDCCPYEELNEYESYDSYAEQVEQKVEKLKLHGV